MSESWEDLYPEDELIEIETWEEDGHLFPRIFVGEEALELKKRNESGTLYLWNGIEANTKNLDHSDVVFVRGASGHEHILPEQVETQLGPIATITLIFGLVDEDDQAETDWAHKNLVSAFKKGNDWLERLEFIIASIDDDLDSLGPFNHYGAEGDNVQQRSFTFKLRENILVLKWKKVKGLHFRGIFRNLNSDN